MRVSGHWSLSLMAGALAIAQTAAAAGGSNAAICETAKERYFSDDEIEIECHETFHHYNAGAVKDYYKARKRHDIHIAGFNVFHLGDNQTRFKDYAAMADIMNQWDVVAAVEVQPLPKTETSLNEALAKYISKFNEEEATETPDGREVTLERLYGDFIPTGYIRLLKELRDLDPSWALVLQSEGVGDGTHTELTGMYYRASHVKPVATAICDGEIGCTSSYSANQQLAVERDPFLASFKAGKFDFTLMGVHLRFREPKQAGAMDLLKRIFNGPDFNVKTNEEVARFAELKTIMNYVGRAAADEEKDLIVVGDFNLTRKDRYLPAWENVIAGLPGARAYLNTPTSVSKKNGLANEYDHFVLNPENTSECDMETAGSFDFLDADAYPRVAEELDRQGERLEEILEQVRAAYKSDGRNYIPMYSSAEIRQIKADFERRMIKSQKSAETKYLAHTELVSDHIPVSVKCSGSAKDDD